VPSFAARDHRRADGARAPAWDCRNQLSVSVARHRPASRLKNRAAAPANQRRAPSSSPIRNGSKCYKRRILE
jgi:hypothetical protein